jgi:hypothetical protein
MIKTEQKLTTFPPSDQIVLSTFQEQDEANMLIEEGSQSSEEYTIDAD